MGLFSWGKKSAKKIATATLEAAKLEAAAATENAAAVREAAEKQAAATAAQTAAAREAADKQALQISENASRSEAASLRQEELIRSQGAASLEASTRQEKLIADQAAAAKAAAEQAAQDQRTQARGNQMQKEGDMARAKAVEAAATLLEQKAPDNVEVTLASEQTSDAEIDPTTKRRRPPRAAFMSNRGSGLTL